MKHGANAIRITDIWVNSFLNWGQLILLVGTTNTPDTIKLLRWGDSRSQAQKWNQTQKLSTKVMYFTPDMQLKVKVWNNYENE